jgi:hypothetical protein
MKYFKIEFQMFHDINRIASRASGEKIFNAESYFNNMRDGQIINNVPIFDYFFLESFDKKEYWEWKLLDVYKFWGIAGLIDGWLISRKLKLLLDEFQLPISHHIYSSKLLYKNSKLNYYIFQFYWKYIFEKNLQYFNYRKSIFWNPVKKENVIVNNEKEFLLSYKNIYRENKSLKEIMQNKKLVLKEKLDFFPMQMFLQDNIISEKLKNTIEENGIEGFEFSELDYEVVVEK